METRLADFIKDTPEGREADAILRACVHCGFCTATCPTYQLLGDELDGPRGRIYLIKQMLEGADVTASTQLHLDRCLSCRSCETTCPSATRWLLRKGLAHRGLFGAALFAGRLARPLLPRALAAKIPAASPGKSWPKPRHARRMLVLEGCVQPALAPSIDAALARVLDRIDISLVRAAGGGCCGAISEHLGAHDEALDYARHNIDAWWPHIEKSAEAILVSASGCGVVVKEYAYLLRDAGIAEASAYPTRVR
jgi:glycolate oxidase iron-sulfur subunit